MNDNPIQRPLGLAALITATVTLFSTGAMEQAGQPGKQNLMAQRPSSGIALSSNAFSPSVMTALQGKAKAPADKQIKSKANRLPPNQQALNKKQLQGPNRHPELPPEIFKERPVDIRTARLMLSVESLFKATTTN